MESIGGAIRMIDWRWFAVAGALFLFGMAAGPLVYRRQIGWLLAYPRRIADFLNRMLHRHRTFGPLFVRIFLINSTSVLTNFLSGFGVVLPLVVITWTGLNMTLLASEIHGGSVRWTRIFNFLAFFELPAAWAMSSAGMRLGMALVGIGTGTVEAAIVSGWKIFLLFSWPLLFVAAVLEAGLIAIANQRADADGNGRLPEPEDLVAPSDRADSDRPRHQGDD